MNGELQLDLWNMDMRSATIVSWFVSEIIVNTVCAVLMCCTYELCAIIQHRSHVVLYSD